MANRRASHWTIRHDIPTLIIKIYELRRDYRLRCRRQSIAKFPTGHLGLPVALPAAMASL